MKAKLLMTLVGVTALTLTGCETFWTGHGPVERHASSLLKYLYPKRLDHVDQQTVPVLTLPLRVGVAFVPEDVAPDQRNFSRSPALTEQERVKLLQQVSAEFQKYPFVKSIEVVPSAYLTPGGGFENLDQLRSMFGVDVMALVSYDQMQFTGASRWSFAYLTVVGAYVIEGERNDTRTMLDAAVYDITSRKLLFRAPGTSEIKGSATPIDLAAALRADRGKGFQRASTNLVTNVDQQLAAFRERVKQNPSEVQIVRSPGYVGAGAVGITELFLLVGLAGVGAMVWRRR